MTGAQRPTDLRVAFLWVVEIWWEMVPSSESEWIFDSSFHTKRMAYARAKKMRKSGYKFRIVKYVRQEPK